MDTPRQPHAVLLIEDDPATRERLAGIVGTVPGLALGAALGDRQSALDWLAGHAPPRVLLVDLELPDGSGIDVIRAARERSPQTEAMVISVFGDEAHVRAGTRGADDEPRLSITHGRTASTALSR